MTDSAPWPELREEYLPTSQHGLKQNEALYVLSGTAVLLSSRLVWSLAPLNVDVFCMPIANSAVGIHVSVPALAASQS